MANIDNPHGFTPIEHLNGNPWNGATRRCKVGTTANDLFVGDAVTLHTSGSGKYPEITHCTAGDGNVLCGVIVSFEPRPATSLESLYIASADTGWANVCMDPDVVYAAQGDDVIGEADIGQNSNVVAGSGDTTTGISGHEVDATTGANGSYQLLIIGAVDKPDNDETLTHAEWKVLISLHQWRAVDAAGGGAAEAAKGV